jgi:hypothetical protein
MKIDSDQKEREMYGRRDTYSWNSKTGRVLVQQYGGQNTMFEQQAE